MSDQATGGDGKDLAAHERDPLASPALGTAADDLIRPCSDRLRPAVPPPPSEEPAFAVALSGGGFRATLTGLGVLRFLADAGLLGRVRYSSSVSGGSIANGLFASRYEALAADDFSGASVDRLLAAPLFAKITTESLQRRLLKGIWRLPGKATRTDLLAEALDEWFFDELSLERLSPTCRFIFNGANLSTGVRFGFERDVLGDYVVGLVPTENSGFRMAAAVACSAAFPGAFSPIEVRGFDFPCANGRVPKILDGGAYDNMGLEPVNNLPQACLVALNAGGTFQVTGRFGRVPIVRDLMRVNALLYRQSTGLRRAEMVERFQAWERARAEGIAPPTWARRGVLFSLATDFEATDEWLSGRPEHEELRLPLALVKTSLDEFPRELCEQLVYRGWWLAGATLSRYHRELLPAELPAWRAVAA